MIDISEIIEPRSGSDYQRDDFDSFLKKVKFSFNLPAIHIAGTNGKGSTASYIASIYQEAGYKVGLFTSPSLEEINEMISINGKLISDDKIAALVNEYKKEIKKYDLSSFEILTFVALSYFKDEKCDISVIECGMGGEVDATNIFTPILSIITSVSLEHTAFLGRTISEIAEQKAGIIKDEIPVLIGDLNDEAKDVISHEALLKETKVHEIAEPHAVTLTEEGYQFTYGTIENISLKSFGLYSVKDACIAVDAIELLNNDFPVNEEQIKVGLSKVNMPCRMELLSKDKLTIIDGAHNPEASEKLAKAIQNLCKNHPIHVLFSCFKDKNLVQMLTHIGSVTDTITLTTFDHIRARKEEDFFLFLNDYEFILDPIFAYKTLKEKYPEDYILITGSLAFAAYMKRRLTNE